MKKKLFDKVQYVSRIKSLINIENREKLLLIKNNDKEHLQKNLITFKCEKLNAIYTDWEQSKMSALTTINQYSTERSKQSNKARIKNKCHTGRVPVKMVK